MRSGSVSATSGARPRAYFGICTKRCADGDRAIVGIARAHSRHWTGWRGSPVHTARPRRRGDRVSLASAHSCCCICSRQLLALPRHSKIGDERLLSEEERSCSRPGEQACAVTPRLVAHLGHDAFSRTRYISLEASPEETHQGPHKPSPRRCEYAGDSI